MGGFKRGSVYSPQSLSLRWVQRLSQGCNVIDVADLVFEYPGHRALDGVSLHIEAGTVTALVGPNGAGKSTLLRCIAGLDRPLSGQLHVAGIPVLEHPREVHQHLGYLSDFFGLYEGLTAEQGLEFAAMARGLQGPTVQVRVQQVAHDLGLSQLLGRKPKELSRGQRQRLAIGQAIVHQPRVLLLDEPASGLDPDARDQLAQLFRQLQAQGMTLVVSSHILSELDAYSTHVLSIRHGRIEHHAPLHASSPSSDDEAAIEAMYVLELASAEGASVPHLQEMPLPRHPETRAAKLAELISQGMPISGVWPARDSVQSLYLRGKQAARTDMAAPSAPAPEAP